MNDLVTTLVEYPEAIVVVLLAAVMLLPLLFPERNDDDDDDGDGDDRDLDDPRWSAKCARRAVLALALGLPAPGHALGQVFGPPSDCQRCQPGPQAGAVVDVNASQKRRPSAQPAGDWSPVVAVQVTDRQGGTWGSGTLVWVGDGLGIVLTNWHVVAERASNTSVTIHWHKAGGVATSGEVIGEDRQGDVAAVLTNPPAGVPSVELKRDTPQIGQWFTWAGYAGGGRALDVGVARHRAWGGAQQSGEFYFLMLSGDRGAASGDSGGPILDQDGCLAGVLWGSDANIGGVETTGACCVRLRPFLQGVIARIRARRQARRGAQAQGGRPPSRSGREQPRTIELAPPGVGPTAPNAGAASDPGLAAPTPPAQQTAPPPQQSAPAPLPAPAKRTTAPNAAGWAATIAAVTGHPLASAALAGLSAGGGAMGVGKALAWLARRRAQRALALPRPAPVAAGASPIPLTPAAPIPVATAAPAVYRGPLPQPTREIVPAPYAAPSRRQWALEQALIYASSKQGQVGATIVDCIGTYADQFESGKLP